MAVPPAHPAPSSSIQAPDLYRVRIVPRLPPAESAVVQSDLKEAMTGKAAQAGLPFLSVPR